MIFNWIKNLEKAINLLERSNIPVEEWSFGGGTALMFLYQHRYSKDIDIFFSNPQYLVYLTPRLNDEALSISKDYEEQSNFLKLFLEDFEIDFIVAGNLTGLKPEMKKIDKFNIYVEHPIEIIAKKIFYRSHSYKARDIIDFVEVYKREKNLVKILKEKKLIVSPEDLLLSVERIKKSDIKRTLEKLSLNKKITKKDFEEYINIFLTALDLK